MACWINNENELLVLHRGSQFCFCNKKIHFKPRKEGSSIIKIIAVSILVVNIFTVSVTQGQEKPCFQKIIFSVCPWFIHILIATSVSHRISLLFSLSPAIVECRLANNKVQWIKLAYLLLSPFNLLILNK